MSAVTSWLSSVYAWVSSHLSWLHLPNVTLTLIDVLEILILTWLFYRLLNWCFRLIMFAFESKELLDDSLGPYFHTTLSLERCNRNDRK